MRRYSNYLDRIKKEDTKGLITVAGSSPPLLKTLKNKSIKMKLIGPDQKLQKVQQVKKMIAKLAGRHADEISLFPASTQACFQTLVATTSPGDFIAIEFPAYEPFLAAAEFLQLQVERFVRSGNAADDVKKFRSSKRRAELLLLSNPHCPTGEQYSRADMSVLAKNFKTVIVDEVFMPMFNKGRITDVAKHDSNVISIGSLTKSTGLNDLRCGWTISDKSMIEPLFRSGLLLHIEMPTPILFVAEFAFKNWSKINGELLALANKNRRVLFAEFAGREDLLSAGFSSGFFGVLPAPGEFASAELFCTEFKRKKFFLRPAGDFEMPQHFRFHLLLPPKDFLRLVKELKKYYRFDRPLLLKK